MSEIVLRDIDPILSERIRRIAEGHGWSVQDALMHLLEHGLFVCEGEMAGRFDDSDATALQAAIAALEEVPDDPGFSLIGRAEPAEPAAPASRGPDQSIARHLFEGHPMPDVPQGERRPNKRDAE
ncbi:hypothetical protein [Lysobacter sp. D1-1-M9]|uniref:hypothetical protein n=1 Tax=Novilysobacter longmucuonensis TaxID=3098603 RepID=UPI002FC5E7AD